jgi:hypothetical protein
MRGRRWFFWLLPPVLCGGFLFSIWRSLEPRIGRAATAADSPVKDLPAGARDIAYFLPGAFGPIKAYEFDISEAEFEAWVKAMPPPKLELMPPDPGENFHSVRRADATGYPNQKHEFRNGVLYLWRFEDQNIVAAYDRSLGRAFYTRSYR